MKLERKITFNGFLYLLRFWFLLLRLKSVSFSTLGAFFMFVAVADWDRRHKTFKYIVQTDAEIAEVLGYNHTTINKQKNKLISIGLLKKDKVGIYIAFFPFFLQEGAIKFNKLDFDFLQDEFATPQELVEIIKNKVEKSKSSDLGKCSSFNVSSNIDSSVSKDKFTKEDEKCIDEFFNK